MFFTRLRISSTSELIAFAGEAALPGDFVSVVFPVAENVEPLEIVNDLLSLPSDGVFSFCALIVNENAVSAKTVIRAARAVGIDSTYFTGDIARTGRCNAGSDYAVYLQFRKS